MLSLKKNIYLILTSGRTANPRIALRLSFFFKYTSSNLAFVFTGYNALYTDFCYYNLEHVNPYLNVYWNLAIKWDIAFTHITTCICMNLIHMYIYKMCNSKSNNTFFLSPKIPKESQFQSLLPTSMVIWSSLAHVPKHHNVTNVNAIPIWWPAKGWWIISLYCMSFMYENISYNIPRM